MSSCEEDEDASQEEDQDQGKATTVTHKKAQSKTVEQVLQGDDSEAEEESEEDEADEENDSDDSAQSDDYMLKKGETEGVRTKLMI